MVRKPNVVIKINGIDKSENIMKHLDSLSIVDNANNESDSLTIVINGRFSRPNKKDQIKVYIGFDDDLHYFGLYRVETTSKSFKSLTINATGVNFSASFKVKRNITYEKVSVRDIVNQISKRHLLKVKCDFTDIFISSLAQTNESDMHFLNRIAKEYNALFNVKNDTLYFVKKIKKNRKNDELPSYRIDLNMCGNTPVIEYSEKTFYNSCEVSWHDTKENKTFVKKVPLNGGDPILKFKGSFKNEAEAIEKAKAKLQRANHGIVKGSLETEGMKIYAGGRLSLDNNFDDDIDEYQISRVNQDIANGGGWTTGVEFEN
ncbi:MAG: hypothetical protein HRT41_02350 [Campylobacteraceae bacterium]|nr:hypothetical protein [Campylobacteraceae bacterium]